MARLQHPLTVLIFTIVLLLLIPLLRFDFQISHILVTVSILVLEIAIITAIYRLTYHPLAVYPGPWYLAVSEAGNVYSCVDGERHLQFKTWHDRYGPVLRYAPDRLSFCDENAIQDIYGARANTRKSKLYTGFNFLFKAPSSLTCIDRKRHASKRKVINHALQAPQLKNYESSIVQNVHILMSEVLGDVSEKEWSDSYDLSEIFKYLFADIMGDVTFSNKWNVQTSNAKRWILDMLPIGTSGLHGAGHILFAFKLKIDRFLLPKTMSAARRFLDISRVQCEERIRDDAKFEPDQDLFSPIIRAVDRDNIAKSSDQPAFTMEELVSEAGFLMVAGGDTTATVATATLFHLLQYPNILARVRHELHSAFSSDPNGIEAIIYGTKLTSCQLLYACIDEAMRLTPPVGSVLPREVLEGGILIGGHWAVPEGCDVGVPAYAIHHDERYWEEPHVFKPERWLSNDCRDVRNTFMPFGIGRTSCVGKLLAYGEVALVIARVLCRYDLRLVLQTQHFGNGILDGKETPWGRGNKFEFQTRDVFTSFHVGPKVQFRKREPEEHDTM